MSHFFGVMRVLKVPLIQLPEFGDLPAGDLLEDDSIVLPVLEAFVQLTDGAMAVSALDPVEKVRGRLITRVPLAVAGFPLPVRRGMSGIQTDPIWHNAHRQIRCSIRMCIAGRKRRTCDAFDQAAGTFALAVVLVAVDHLVDEDSEDLALGA